MPLHFYMKIQFTLARHSMVTEDRYRPKSEMEESVSSMGLPVDQDLKMPQFEVGPKSGRSAKTDNQAGGLIADTDGLLTG